MKAMPFFKSGESQERGGGKAPRPQFAHGGGVRRVDGTPLTQDPALLLGHALGPAAAHAAVAVHVACGFCQDRFAIYTFKNKGR